MDNQIVKHVLGLSGGKDSAALALYMAENYPDLPIEYFFTDTHSELPEVYDFIEKLEAALDKPIIKLNPLRNFNHYFAHEFDNFLPSPKQRWCTVQLKLKPFEQWINPTLKAGGKIFSYIAIRADEDRLGYNPANSSIVPVFPFVEDGIDLAGVQQILKSDPDLGIPKYYDWRSRSGCTFCFYQQKIEWVRLFERHPDKFKEAVDLEKASIASSIERGGSAFTWSERETLEELTQPDRIEQIKFDYDRRLQRLKKKRKNALHEGFDFDAEQVDVDEVYGRELEVSVCVTCHK